MSQKRRFSNIALTVTLAVVLAVAGVSAGPASADAGPLTTVSNERVTAGVVHRVLQGETVRAHVAEIDTGAPVDLRVVPAAERIGALERTSSMCARVGCLVAVNGDFQLPGTRLPVGGVVRGSELLKSPSDIHEQLVISPGGDLAAGRVDLTGRLVPTDLEEVRIDGVNGERIEDSLILYTRAVGPRTGTNRHGVEVAVTPVQPAGPLRLGQTTLVELGDVIRGGGNAPIPPDGAVLSGHGSGAEELEHLLEAVDRGDVGRRALLRLETDPEASESVGGFPVLLRDGRRWFKNEPASFVRGRHPRTAIGWNAEGDVWLVVVDGRRPAYSEGMTLLELAELLLDLGATEAVNLDGGGTSTFVVGGRVVNRPSDQLVQRGGVEQVVHVPTPSDVVLNDSVERPAVNALTVVPDSGATPVPDPLASNAIDLPAEPDAMPPVTADPASSPRGALPALVGATPPPRLEPAPVALAAVALALASLALGFTRRRVS